MHVSASAGPISDKLLWVAQLLPMPLHLSRVAPQGALDFPAAFPLINPQQARVATACFGEFVGILLGHICVRPASCRVLNRSFPSTQTDFPPL